SKNCSYGSCGASHLAKTAPPTQITMIANPISASLRFISLRRTEGPVSGTTKGSADIDAAAIGSTPLLRLVLDQPFGGGLNRYAPGHCGLAKLVIGLGFGHPLHDEDHHRLHNCLPRGEPVLQIGDHRLRSIRPVEFAACDEQCGIDALVAHRLE